VREKDTKAPVTASNFGRHFDVAEVRFESFSIQSNGLLPAAIACCSVRADFDAGRGSDWEPGLSAKLREVPWKNG
jgi:hypothetical protein